MNNWRKIIPSLKEKRYTNYLLILDHRGKKKYGLPIKKLNVDIVISELIFNVPNSINNLHYEIETKSYQ